MTDAIHAEGNPYVLFKVAGAHYALPSQVVLHVEMVEDVTPVPNAHPFVDGAVFSRGRVIPVVNCRARFGFGRTDVTLKSRLLVLQSQGRRVGLLVDAAREFRKIVPEAIMEPPAEMQRSSRYVVGVAHMEGRLVFVLNVEALLDFDGSEDLEEIAREFTKVAREGGSHGTFSKE